MLKLSWKRNKTFDIGHADEYIGEQYSYPYFFETSNKLMMRDMGKDNINFKTWKGEYYQFFLDKFHSNKALVLVSTLGDCCFFKQSYLSIKGMQEWAKMQSEKKHPIKNSYSGYFTFGQKMLRQYDKLEEHLKEQEIYFPDDILEEIYQELIRRDK